MRLITIDTETGGLNPAHYALLSVSAVELNEKLEPTRQLDLFIHQEPGRNVSAEAAAVNGYSESLWNQRGAVSLRVAMRDLAKWIGVDRRLGDPLAHNAPFDKGFLEAAAELAGVRLPLSYRWRCSMGTMMAVDDAYGLRFPNYKLDTLARACGHWKEGHERGAHQAADDTLACAAGYRWLIEKMRGAQAQQQSIATGGGA